MSAEQTQLPTADLAPTGRAKCMQCAQAIAKGTVRIAVLRSIDTGSFVTQGPGYMHPACAKTWAETQWEAGFSDLAAQVLQNSSLPTIPEPFGNPTDTIGGTIPSQNLIPKLPAKTPPFAEPKAPPFGSLSDKKLASLAAKLLSSKDEYKADSLIEKAGVAWGDRAALRWHLCRYGLVSPTHVSMLSRLGESTTEADMETVFAVLPKLATPTTNTSDVLPKWSGNADRIVLRAMQLDPVRLATLAEHAPHHLRLGIQFVRGRSGIPLPESDRKAVLDALAECEGTYYGLPRFLNAEGSYLYVHNLDSQLTVPTCYKTAFDLAKHFGSFSEWQQALCKHASRGLFSSVELVVDGLSVMPLSQLVSALTKAHFSGDDRHYQALETLLLLRKDDPLELATAAQTIDIDDYPASYMRELLLLFALGQLGEQKRSVPEGLELALKWDNYSHCIAPWRGSAIHARFHKRALSALSPSRIHELIRKRFLRDYAHNTALALLSSAFDEKFLREILSSVPDPNSLDPNAGAGLGVQALPLFVSYKQEYVQKGVSAAKTPADYAKGIEQVDRCIRFVLGYVSAESKKQPTVVQPVSEQPVFEQSWDTYLSVSDPQDYWHEEDRHVFLHLLRGMTDSRRIAALRRLFAQSGRIERVFSGVHLVEDPAFRKEAATTVVKQYGTIRDLSLLERGIVALPSSGLASFAPALIAEKPDSKLFDLLARCFDKAQVDALQKQADVKTERPLDRLFRLSAQAQGPKVRIYLLEHGVSEDVSGRDSEDDTENAALLKVRVESFSRSRGIGPTSANGGTPKTEPTPSAKGKRKGRTNEDEEHILTLDLEDIPELAALYPGMRALSFYAVDPDSGAYWEKARLTAIPMGSAPPTDGSPVAVLPLEVPAAVFDTDESREDVVLKDIRNLVFNRPGYALGEPMYIQGDEEGEGRGTFLFQLSESMGGLNLGDCGSLYVFTGGSFMQCY